MKPGDGVECIPLVYAFTAVASAAAVVVKSASVDMKTCPAMATNGPSGTEPGFQMERPLAWRKNPCN